MPGAPAAPGVRGRRRLGGPPCDRRSSGIPGGPPRCGLRFCRSFPRDIAGRRRAARSLQRAASDPISTRRAKGTLRMQKTRVIGRLRRPPAGAGAGDWRRRSATTSTRPRTSPASRPTRSRTARKVGQQLIDDRIVAAIDAAMAAKGFTKSDANPDVVVVYHVAFDKEKDISTYSSGYGGGYGAYGYGLGRRLGRRHDDDAGARHPGRHAGHRHRRRQGRTRSRGAAWA